MHEETFVRLKTNTAKTLVLGAALTQNGKPVAFTSRALTAMERGYAQIEKECLAIAFGMEKFHQYTYGHQVTVQSDHKPLENILKKPLLSCSKKTSKECYLDYRSTVFM